MIRYNAEELFQMAESVERDGALFYRRAAEASDSPDTSELFTRLADWEEKHEKLFAELRQSLPDSARHEDGPGDPVEEHAAAYLQAFVDGKVFPAPSWATAAGETPAAVPRSALEFALDREKDTIILFLTMQEHVPKYWGREQVQKIVAEELKHVHMIEAQLRDIT
ncbi:MAG: ferritin-like domain-containing protein [bacterium]